jgi:RDD family
VVVAGLASAGQRGGRHAPVASSHPYPTTEPPYAPPSTAADPTAVMGRRVAAWVVDSVIILAPSVALFTNELEFLEESDLDQSGTDFCEDYMDRNEGVCVDVGDRVYFSDGVPVAPWAAFLGLSVLIYVLIQGLKGWTPGKLLFGIRTVAGDGRAPGIGRAAIRWLFLIVDGLCAGLVGFIVALTSRGHRRVGDMAAKTFVVGGRYMGHPIAVPGMTTNYTPYPAHPGYPGDRPPADQPQTWAPPPTWGPAPTWAPPPETTPQEGTVDESPADAPAVPGEAGEGSAAPQHPKGTAPAPAPAPTDVEPAAGPPAGDVAGAEQPSAEAGSTAEAATPDYNPQWDAARGTYIVWSAERGHWLGWDDVAKEWKPL